MKAKTKVLTIVTFFLLCIGLLPLTAEPFPHPGLNQLFSGSVQAEELCCAYWDPYYEECIQWVPCNGYGSTPTSRVPEEEPARPSDEVDWWGRLAAFDPNTPDIRVDFPLGAVSVPAQLSAYRPEELPADVSLPANGSVGAPFYLGVWIKGEGKTVSEFDRSIVINVSYQDADLSQAAKAQPAGRTLAKLLLERLLPSPNLPLASVTYPALAIFSFDGSASGHTGYISPSDEENLRLSMYDPDTQAWVKLCSRVDSYGNKVSAALLLPKPLEEGGNALFAIIPDDTPGLEQSVDDQGNTTLSIPGSNFELEVKAGTVEVGTHFEMTLLTGAPDSDLFRLLPTPVDIKACQADYESLNRIRQITQFPRSMNVEFGYDAGTSVRAGGKGNLTIVSLQERQWTDMEEFGSRVVRGDTTVSVDTGDLGTFSLAVR